MGFIALGRVSRLHLLLIPTAFDHWPRLMLDLTHKHWAGRVLIPILTPNNPTHRAHPTTIQAATIVRPLVAIALGEPSIQEGVCVCVCVCVCL